MAPSFQISPTRVTNYNEIKSKPGRIHGGESQTLVLGRLLELREVVSEEQAVREGVPQ